MLPAHHYDLTVMLHTGVVLAGRFRLERRIGAGGVGEVWRAVDLSVGAPVAVKVFRSDFAWPPETLTRFRAEARQASSVSHPGLARVYYYDDGDPPVPPYLVTELVMGPSLARVLANGPLDPARAMDVIGQAAAALSAAHEAGLVHGDIKPANLIIGQGGEVKITDFGIAAAAASALAHTGAPIGTPDYLAPECSAGRPATWASDLYSLGVVSYECLDGLPPFDGPPLEVATAHRNYRLPPLPADVPGTVATFVAKLTAKDPRDRPTSADQASWWAMQLRDSMAGGPGVLPRSWQAGAVAVAAPGPAHGPGDAAPACPPRAGYAEPPAGLYPPGADPGPATLARLEPAALAGAGPVMPIDLTRIDGDQPAPYPREGYSRPPYPRTDRRVELYRRRARTRNRLAVLLTSAAAAVAVLIALLAFDVFRGSPAAMPAAATPARASAHAARASAHAARASAHATRASAPAPVPHTVLVTAAALVGKPATLVRADLRKLGLKPHLVKSVTTAQAPGQVVSVQPGGKLPAGSTVTVTEAVAAAPPVPVWVAYRGTVSNLYQASPAAATYFFSRPGSYIKGGTDHLAGTAVAGFRSYAAFVAALPTLSRSKWPWVAYDPESWSLTPLAERQNPAYYMQQFGKVAHAHGFRVLMLPARDLAQTDTACRKGSMSYDQWYLTCKIAKYAVMNADALEVQAQADMANTAAYDALVNGAKAQAHAQNPAAQVVAELSPSRGTAAQAFAAASSVHVSGYAFMPVSRSQVGWLVQLLADFRAAGL